jgi:hypothetical protein
MALGRGALLAAAAALVLCGCGGGDPGAMQAAMSFGAALGAGDLTRACELLAPATRATLEYQPVAGVPAGHATGQPVCGRGSAGGGVGW